MSETLDFNHHSPDANADPVAYYERFRTACPVGRTDQLGGFVYTSRYADIARIARDDSTFSSARSNHGGRGVEIVIPKGHGLEQFPIELDPPQSVDYRELINPLLTADAVDALRPMIVRHATRIVDEFIELGSCDFVRDLTNPLPAAVTLDWLGFPESEWAKLAGPIHDIFAAESGSERAMQGAAGLAYMDDCIRDLIRERRKRSQDDAVSTLVASRRKDGTEFGEDELVSVIGLLIAGGVDTTTSLTGWTLVHLARNGEHRARLIESPDLLDSATEEFLRAASPSQSMARTVTTDTTVGGCPVRAGDRILIPWVAANYDPEVFPEPQQIKLDRDASRHLSFGIGSHRCVGAHLARAMFREMMTQVLTRLPDYRIVEEGLVAYPTSGNQAGFDAIPALFTPGDRTAGDLTDRIGPALPQQLTISAVTARSSDVLGISLRQLDGSALPCWQPGTHVELRLPSGRLRQYSLCGDPENTEEWHIGVLREATGRGGSQELHDIAQAGATLTLRGLRNHFRLVDASHYVFIAGGIGVTPILAMARDAAARDIAFTVTYGGRSRSTMAFIEDLQEVAGDRLTLLPQDEVGLPDLATLLGSVHIGTAIYACGPARMLLAIEEQADALGISDQLHTERFTAGGDLEVNFDASLNTEFEVKLARSGATVTVPPDKRLIEALKDVLPGLSYDCEKGYCGACETRVLAGTPEHRDSILTEQERAAGRSMMICVGRCSSPRLVLDL